MSDIVFAKTSEVEAGKIVSRRFGRNRVAVCNIDGKYYAFKDACTHDNAPISDGEICENAIICPRHGAKFDLETGDVLSAPAYSPLKKYGLTIENDHIKVNLE